MIFYNNIIYIVFNLFFFDMFFAFLVKSGDVLILLILKIINKVMFFNYFLNFKVI